MPASRAKKKTAATNTPSSEPKGGRPAFAKGYKIRTDEKGLVAWKYVIAELEKSKNYWISSTRPDGRPHAMPVWGVWVNGAVCFGTDRMSRKARNFQANPSVSLHLESGDDVVIIEGTVREIAPKDMAAMDAAYFKKYKMKLSDAPGEPYFLAVVPRVVFAWHERNFAESPTRWVL
jgi:nitroimidazol reductase NimA-like FMN-containing flavoprotein (pyridoxamine 5'-phosphate oxidase superfamily)